MKKALYLLKTALVKLSKEDAAKEIEDLANDFLNEAEVLSLIETNNADWEDGESAPSYLRKKAGEIFVIRDWDKIEEKFGENGTEAKSLWEDFANKDNSGEYDNSVKSYISFYRNKENLNNENKELYLKFKSLMKKPEKKIEEEVKEEVRQPSDYSSKPVGQPISNFSYEESDEMYKKILEGIGAPVTQNNITYMRAWRKAEGGKATFNPFNTTQKYQDATNYNSVGVKNYPTMEAGIEATVKTLLNGRYNDIVDSLKSDSPPQVTAASKSLSVWGTGGGVLSVLNRSQAKPRSGVLGRIGDALKGSQGSAKHVLGGAGIDWFPNGYSGGPRNHATRRRGNWQSDNAWDLGAPEGTPVYSITTGTVVKVKQSTPSKDGKVYGISITVDGGSTFPSVFYTHLGSATVSVGDTVKFGQQIGTVGASSDPKMPRHVHIGLESGHISSYVSESGDIKMA
jgi:murein DD-endopeptidase MepM/ murein hydrolase activator NlpD